MALMALRHRPGMMGGVGINMKAVAPTTASRDNLRCSAMRLISARSILPISEGLPVALMVSLEESIYSHH